MSDDDAPLSRTGVWITRLFLLLLVAGAIAVFLLLGR